MSQKILRDARFFGAALSVLIAPGHLLAQSSQQPKSAITHPEKWPRGHWPVKPVSADEAKIRTLLGSMTIEQKVGQILQADIASIMPGDVRRYHLGSVLNGGNSAPGNDEFAPPEKWLALADALYAESVDRSDGNAGIPIIWGTDAVHGHSNIVGATLFPHNIGLGAAHDPALIERIGRATALEIRATVSTGLSPRP